MKILKDPWVIVFLGLIFISSIPIFLNFLPQPSGVLVISVENPTCTVENGDVITEVRGKSIKTSQDFYSIVKSLKKGEYVSMVINGGPGGCKVIEDGNLGVKVSDIKRSRIRLSVELGGGKKILISTNQTQKMVEILRKRAKLLNLHEIEINTSNSFVEITYPKYVSLDKLLSKGEFKATIGQELEIENETVKIKVGANEYVLKVGDSYISFQNQRYEVGKSLYLDNIEIRILNITNRSVIIEEKIFNSKDVVRMFKEFSSVRYNPSTRNYEFYIPVEISENASKRIIKVTRGLKTTLLRDELIFQGFLNYYLDGKKISSLVIPFRVTLEGIKNINVLGFSENSRDALKKMALLEISLETGALPEFQIVEEVEVKSKPKILVQISIFLITIFVSLLIVSSIALKRKGFYFSLVSISTSFIVLGISLISQLISRGIIIDKLLLFSLLGVFLFSFFDLCLLQKKKKRKYLRFFKISLLVLAIFSLFWIENFGVSLLLFLLLTPIIENLSKRL